MANGVPVARNARYAAHGGLKTYTLTSGLAPDYPRTLVDVEPDPNLMPRPFAIVVEHGASSDPLVSGGRLGDFSYDGDGNIAGIGGGDLFRYDSHSRLVYSSQAGIVSDFAYDVLGNMNTMSRSGQTRSFQPAAATNQYANGFGYDIRGRATTIPALVGDPTPAQTLTWDAFDRMTSTTQNTVTWNYVYDASGERHSKNTFGTYPTPYVFTLRDPKSHVVTEYRREVFSGSFTQVPQRDNFFLGNTLVASHGLCQAGDNAPPYWQYYVQDHLGSTWYTADLKANEQTVLRAKHAPFGENIITPQTAQRHSFAAMERDNEEQAGSRFYDHARSHDGRAARFLSPDILSGKVENPQSWNRYAYALNNPLKYVDPNGRETVTGNLAAQYRAFALTHDEVYAVYKKFIGPGTPDLVVERGNPGFDKPKPGEKLGEQFPSDFRVNDVDVDKNQLKKATITVGKSILDTGKGGLLDVFAHETGHAKTALADPKNYNNRVTQEEKSPGAREDRPLEQEAIKFRDTVCGKGQECKD